MDKSQVIKIAVAVVLLIVALGLIIWYLTSSSSGGSAGRSADVGRGSHPALVAV